MNLGKLYLVPTPIGNLKDITLRALEVLKFVDIVAAEDTRQTLKLLNHFEIKKSLMSYHKHNEQEKSEDIIELLKEGHNIAIVTDAGTPGISDPGAVIVKKCINENIDFETKFKYVNWKYGIADMDKYFIDIDAYKKNEEDLINKRKSLYDI